MNEDASLLQSSDGAEGMLRGALDLQASLAKRYPRVSAHKFCLAHAMNGLVRLVSVRAEK